MLITLGTFVVSAAKNAIEDRAGGLVNKVYVTRQGSSGSPEAVSDDEVWTSSATYRAAKFVNPEVILGPL